MSLPTFLQFRPEADTMQASLQVQGMLQHLEKMVTAQHVVAQRLGQDGVLPALVTLYDWSIRSQRDIVSYVAGLAEYLRDGGDNVELAIPADLAADLVRLLTEARAQLEKPDPEAVAALLPQLADAIEAVNDATYDGTEEEEAEEEAEEPFEEDEPLVDEEA